MNIGGWEELITAKQFNKLLYEVSIYIGNRENFNTMTENGMRTLGAIDEDVISRLIKDREKTVFKSLSEVNRAAGSIIPADPLLLANIPSHYLRMILWSQASGQQQWIGITLTPRSMLAPWEIDYRFNVNRDISNPALKGSNDSDNATMAATSPSSTLLR